VTNESVWTIFLLITRDFLPQKNLELICSTRLNSIPGSATGSRVEIRFLGREVWALATLGLAVQGMSGSYICTRIELCRGGFPFSLVDGITIDSAAAAAAAP
jgi:hypothetical protein